MRKILESAFIKEVLVYPDKIIITFNFTDRRKQIKRPTEYADTGRGSYVTRY